MNAEFVFSYKTDPRIFETPGTKILKREFTWGIGLSVKLVPRRSGRNPCLPNVVLFINWILFFIYNLIFIKKIIFFFFIY